MGQKLVSTLNQLIDARAIDMPRVDIVRSMASAAGIEVIDVSHILQGDIDCPPIKRLQDFATVLGINSEAALRSAAESDGCDYVDRTSGAVPIREVISKEQYLRLQQISQELERALEPGSSVDS